MSKKETPLHDITLAQLGHMSEKQARQFLVFMQRLINLHFGRIRNCHKDREEFELFLQGKHKCDFSCSFNHVSKRYCTNCPDHAKCRFCDEQNPEKMK